MGLSHTAIHEGMKQGKGTKKGKRVKKGLMPYLKWEIKPNRFMTDDDQLLITTAGRLVLSDQRTRTIIGLAMSKGEFYYLSEKYDEDQRRLVTVRIRAGDPWRELPGGGKRDK